MTDEERVRDLLGQAFAVEPPASVHVVADQVRADHRKRSQVRRGMGGVALLVVVVGSVVLPGTLGTHGSAGGSLAATGPATPTTPAQATTRSGMVDPHKVLEDGDLVQASGRVVKVPGKPVRFCGPEMNDLVLRVPAPPPAWCPAGVDVVGVDLVELSMHRTDQGASEGYAYLRGTWSGGVLHVSLQTAPRYDTALTPDVSNPPCTKPAGGWPVVPAGSNPMSVEGQIDAFRTSHPGEIVSEVVARPNAHAAYMVLTVEDLAAVHEALQDTPGKLCILQSRYTNAQISAVRTPWEQDLRKHGNDGQGLVTSIGQGVGPDAQATIELDVLMTTPLVAQRLAAAPVGLLTVKPWLQPISAAAPLPPLPVTPTAVDSFSTAAAAATPS